MVSSVIWVVIYAKPPNAPIGPIFEERKRVGADMMYPRRFQQARAMAARDRVVVHFGGPVGSDPYAQYLVLAGCVREMARPLTTKDAGNFERLLRMTADGFPHFQTDHILLPQQGIIFYDLYDRPAGVAPLPRPYPAPKRGENFIKLLPGSPVYQKVDDWWHKVVPKGCCGKE